MVGTGNGHCELAFRRNIWHWFLFLAMLSLAATFALLLHLTLRDIQDWRPYVLVLLAVGVPFWCWQVRQAIRADAVTIVTISPDRLQVSFLSGQCKTWNWSELTRLDYSDGNIIERWNIWVGVEGTRLTGHGFHRQDWRDLTQWICNYAEDHEIPNNISSDLHRSSDCLGLAGVGIVSAVTAALIYFGFKASTAFLVILSAPILAIILLRESGPFAAFGRFLLVVAILVWSVIWQFESRTDSTHHIEEMILQEEKTEGSLTESPASDSFQKGIELYRQFRARKRMDEFEDQQKTE